MNQPYQAPSSNVAVAAEDAVYQPKMFSASGRIGRMRYFVYGAVMSIAFYAVMAVAVGIIAAVSGGLEQAQQGAGMVVLGFLYFAMIIAVLVFAVIFMVRRLNDFNASGWLSLLLLVPLANLVMMLLLLFKKGTAGGNDYGPAPTENSGRVKAVFWVALILWLVVFVGGIIAAVSIPAYQDYMQRADAAQQMEFSDY
ncbi:DUF805 domain-containing protein [Alcanivorax sp. DP30]|uniref:DUF805 domain-containing protein n=1 Tax=Alcanivorax sp. DP30 TaxID=2606217 RepID=UPI0013687245|nr:DUF805 domain-containing protein [Alcanivorax sp. DP30]MZR61670.1 DUF805 domain-containing protein [Alcanivorax sp. DP30]